jgi:hypothetical protein
MARPQNVGRSLIFYSYSPELIARWCRVSLTTAKAYGLGTRKPSRQALSLFTLHRDGKVLGPEWRDFHIAGDKIADTDGNVTTASQLAGYAAILQWVAAVAARSEDTQQQYYELLKRA